MRSKMAVISYEITGIRPLASFEIGTLKHKINQVYYAFERKFLSVQQPATLLLEIPKGFMVTKVHTDP